MLQSEIPRQAPHTLCTAGSCFYRSFPRAAASAVLPIFIFCKREHLNVRIDSKLLQILNALRLVRYVEFFGLIFLIFLLFLFFKKEDFLTFTKKVTCGASEGNHLKKFNIQKAISPLPNNSSYL